jgi:nitrile hydratase
MVQTMSNAETVIGPLWALDQYPEFTVGDIVEVASRMPVGHYRVPQYLRGKPGEVTKVILPIAVDNEQEGYGRNAGSRRHYYRVRFRMAELWASYEGGALDQLYIEIFETWLARVAL